MQSKFSMQQVPLWKPPVCCLRHVWMIILLPSLNFPRVNAENALSTLKTPAFRKKVVICKPKWLKKRDVCQVCYSAVSSQEKRCVVKWTRVKIPLFPFVTQVRLLPVFLPHLQNPFVYFRLRTPNWWREDTEWCHLTPQAFTPRCSHTHPPLFLSPTWLPLRSTSGGGLTQRETITQVALPATRMYLSLDPPGPWQEANRSPSDPLWWPFLSPCCLTGRKDAVCCPQAPLTCSSLLSPTRETRLLIPGLSLLMPAFFF